MNKGILFTYDALIALALLSAGMALVLVFSNYDATAGRYTGLESIGRDYLTEKYENNIDIDEADVLQLSGRTVSETPPVGEPLVVYSSAFEYLDLCNCTTTACTLENGLNASCLQSQDINSSIKKEVWVTP
ncbi:hypothetical protein H0O03_02615 [Candidatus Micrarchaeota archaeon]|nr:hypothetical protein [Candidatus Micrarchaeota archaeon]